MFVKENPDRKKKKKKSSHNTFVRLQFCYSETFAKMFCKFAVAWPVFDVVLSDVWRSFWKLFPCMSNIQDLVLGPLQSVNYFPFLAVLQLTFYFSAMFNLSLVMSLTVFICGPSLHFPQGCYLIGENFVGEKWRNFG